MVVGRADPIEYRTRKVHTFLKPSEYKEFLSYIGRSPVSPVMRDLVLDFNRRKAAQNNS